MSGRFWETVTLGFVFVTACCPSFGQSKKQDGTFPAYQQLKASQPEIFDRVLLPVSSQSPKERQLFSTASHSLNLFDYPAGTVTYYLNDQPTTDVKYVKEVLSTKSISVETILVSEPADDGKRTIRIKYEAL